MGLLSLGSPLSWQETKKHADHVREHGIIQFLHIYNRLQSRQNDVLKWGDEVSLGVVFINKLPQTYIIITIESYSVLLLFRNIFCLL